VLGLRRLAWPASLWLAGLAVAAGALQWPAPLLINLGAGDAPFVRDFRPGWERDGLKQTGETMFRWTLDGARLVLPLHASSGEPTVRIRCARFVDPATPVSVLSGGRVVDRWMQPPRGWWVREIDLGPARGPLSLEFRSPLAPDRMGIAIDWVEIRGVTGLLPGAALAPGLAAWLLGLPLLTGFALGRRALCVAALVFPGLASAAILLDRFGGLVAVSDAGAPALVACVALALLARLLRRPLGRSAGLHLAIAGGGAALALLVLSHPFFYYPDLDIHAGFTRALSSDPGLALDPTPFQLETGAWTREIGGRRVGFPYSPAFHILAAPLAPLLGFERAVETLGAVALGVTSLLVAALASALSMSGAAAAGGQLLLLVLPVTASRLSLALFPALLGQALDLGVALGLAAFLPAVSPGGRARLAALLLAAQMSYTGSMITVPLLVAVYAALDGRRLGLRAIVGLFATTIGTALIVAIVLYARFLPTLVEHVLPHAFAGRGGEPRVGGLASRVWLFFGPAGLVLVPLGVSVLRRSEPGPRRVHFALLLAGSTLLTLRFVAPGVFRDVKEVEMLTPPAAVAGAAALDWLWRQGLLGRFGAGVGGLGLALWGIAEAWRTYGGRFLAVGL